MRANLVFIAVNAALMVLVHLGLYMDQRWAAGIISFLVCLRILIVAGHFTDQGQMLLGRMALPNPTLRQAMAIIIALQMSGYGAWWLGVMWLILHVLTSTAIERAKEGESVDNEL